MIKVKQAGKIIKFSKTYSRNYRGKPKNCTLKALIQKTKKITDNRTFWKTVVPLFTNKASKGEKIILNEAEKHISDNKNIQIKLSKRCLRLKNTLLL